MGKYPPIFRAQEKNACFIEQNTPKMWSRLEVKIEMHVEQELYNCPMFADGGAAKRTVAGLLLGNYSVIV